MPLRSDWQPAREGLTIDAVGRALAKTVLNPYLTLPLWLLAKYTARGEVFSQSHDVAVRRLQGAVLAGLVLRFNNWLSDQTINNWTNDQYNWDREVVIVTGGSDGIGRRIVEMFAEKGVKCAILDIQGPTYTLPPSAKYFSCDITSPEAISKAAASIRSELGQPTVLINNAGIGRGKTILESTPVDVDLTFRVNTFSHFALLKEFLPYMVEKNHGSVVTVASAAGYVTAPRMADYAGSKAAAVALHEALTSELVTLYNAPKVRTVLCTQGYTKTTLFRGFDPGDGFVSYALEPDSVAEAIVRAVLSGRSANLALPGLVGSSFSAGLRGQPLWLQHAFRNRMVKVMQGFSGRQVAQPSEKDGAKA